MSVFRILLWLLPAISFIIWYGKFRWRRRRLYKLASEFNGPKGLPLLGNVAEIRVPNTKRFDFVLKLFLSYPSPFRLWIGSHLVIFINKPNDFEIVLKNPKALNKEMLIYGKLQPLIGDGLVTAPVDKWKTNRKLISPAFGKKRIGEYFDTFCLNAVHVLQDIKKEEGKGVFDVYPYISVYATNTIATTSMGIDIQSTKFNHSKLLYLGNRILELLTLRMTNVWYFLDALYYFSVSKIKTNECTKAFLTIIETAIADWKFQHSIDSSTTTSESETRHSKPMLKYLLDLPKDETHFSDREIRDEVATILFTGSETNATAVGFVLLVLGIYPEIQKKVYQEIIDVVGSDRPLFYDDLKKLDYMERVIKETLRMFPVGVFIARTADEDIPLTTNTIPAGSTIILGILGIHRNPEVWPNPNKFDPDRFLPEEVVKRHPYSWVPFSSGPRNCIGIRYAWISMKIMLFTILREYFITTPYKSIEDIPLNLAISLKVVDGYKIQIHRRNGVEI